MPTPKIGKLHEDKEAAPNWGPIEKTGGLLLAGLGALGSLVSGFVALSSADGKAIGIAVMGIGAIILAALTGWLWHQGKLRLKAPRKTLRRYLLEKLREN